VNRHPQDTENLLDFIRLLRQMLDTKYPNEHKLITAAVSAYVFKGSDQKPITELDKGWATYMDAFYIMVNI
jgi:chitinase